ncbi:MAG: hypothetical protein Q4D02_03130 [Clostridia bacterium]|nr:hypothetical protein [Clostridia bacterium]
MNMISRIKDGDIGQKSIKFSTTKIHCGAYGIVKKEDKIALINVTHRGYYLLPGNIVTDNEDYRSSFLKTVFQQTGCKIDIEKVIGAIEEERCLTRYKQTSYAFIANVIEAGKKEEYSDDEIFYGIKVEWINEDRALSMIANAYNNLNIDDAEDLYKIKFEVKRSQTILEEYLKNK